MHALLMPRMPSAVVCPTNFTQFHFTLPSKRRSVRLYVYMQAYDRPNSAYMLFYERADALEPVTMMDEIAASAPKEAASLAAGLPVSDVPRTSDPAEVQTATG